MTTSPFARTMLFLIILLSSVLIVKAQNQQPAKDDQPSPPINVDVVYTGRLFGYFRSPSVQQIKATPGCHEGDSRSPAADRFLEKQKVSFTKSTVLVGTGDNFAPQLEAREFAVDSKPNEYVPGKKELYVGNGNEWLPYKELKKPANETLRKLIESGKGTIPSDNVACFLRRAGYAAIVPGKHDFYFGPERLRQLARFLARPAEDGGFTPVQMLGANLVMKTEPIESAAVSSKADRKFEDWPTDYPVMNLSDEGSVYPWFSVVKIQLAGIPSESKILEVAKQKIAKTNVKSIGRSRDLYSSSNGQFMNTLLLKFFGTCSSIGDA